MKATLPQKAWPAPAKTENGTPAPRATAADNSSTISRITLALLDEYSDYKNRGYDPYDTRSTHHRPVDVWSRKPKRD